MCVYATSVFMYVYVCVFVCFVCVCVCVRPDYYCYFNIDELIVRASFAFAMLMSCGVNQIAEVAALSL